MPAPRPFLLLSLGLAVGAASLWVWCEKIAARAVLATAAPIVLTRTVAAPPPPRDDSLTQALAQDNARLRAELAALREQLTRLASTQRRAQTQLDVLRRPLDQDIASSTLKATLRPGEVVVTGGYRTTDGRRMFAFVSPVGSASAGSGLAVRAEFVELTEAQTQAAQLNNLTTNAANTLQHGEVWLADEVATTLANLGEAGDLRERSSSRARPAPLDKTTDLDFEGLKITVTPRRGTGTGVEAGSLDFELRLEQPLPLALEEASGASIP
jgi:hypothetical protein